MSELKHHVFDILEKDNDIINYKDEMKLYKLKDLDLKKEWDYSLPTLVNYHKNSYISNKISKKVYDNPAGEILNNESFRFLKNITWDNLLLAGGSLGDILSGSNVKGDIDMFIYADSDELANKTLERLLNEIVSNRNISNAFSNKSFREKLTFVKTKYTLKIVEFNFQVIFRRYSSIAEILHGFDLGSSAVGFAGKDLYFTILSKFSYEYGCIIVDTKRRSTTFEKRLEKYFKRNFNVVLPYFDINKLSTGKISKYEIPEICEFPYFAIEYNKVHNNQINVTKFLFPKTNTFISDYDDIDYDDKYKLFYRNLSKVLKHDNDNIVFIYDNYKDIFAPFLEKYGNCIKAFYQTLGEKILNNNSFPTSMVENYISLYDANEVFKNRKDIESIKNMLNNQTEHAINLFRDIKENDLKVKWISEMPGSQITSSFNPIITNPSDWYGEYFALVN